MARATNNTKRAAAPRRAAAESLLTYDYLLRGVDVATWEQFKARADASALPVRQVLLQLVGAFASGAIVVEQTTSVRAVRGGAK